MLAAPQYFHLLNRQRKILVATYALSQVLLFEGDFSAVRGCIDCSYSFRFHASFMTESMNEALKTYDRIANCI
jgi:hypothetical protein